MGLVLAPGPAPEGLALMNRADLTHAEIIRFTRPADASRWLRQF
jgi:hypothetical protein